MANLLPQIKKRKPFPKWCAYDDFKQGWTVYSYTDMLRILLRIPYWIPKNRCAMCWKKNEIVQYFYNKLTQENVQICNDCYGILKAEGELP